MSVNSENKEYRRLVAMLANDKNIRIEKFEKPRDLFLADLGPIESLCIVSQGANTLCEIDDDNVRVYGTPVTSASVCLNIRNLVENIYNARKHTK